MHLNPEPFHGAVDVCNMLAGGAPRPVPICPCPTQAVMAINRAIAAINEPAHAP